MPALLSRVARPVGSVPPGRASSRPLPSPWVSALPRVAVLVVTPLPGLTTARVHRGGAGNLGTLESSRQVLRLNEKVKVLRKEKNCVLRLPRCTVGTNLLIVSLQRGRKEFIQVLASHLRLQKSQPQCMKVLS